MIIRKKTEPSVIKKRIEKLISFGSQPIGDRVDLLNDIFDGIYQGHNNLNDGEYPDNKEYVIQ